MVDAYDIQQLINMRGLTILPFHPSHMDRINISDDDKGLFHELPDLESRMEDVARSGTAWTIFYNRQPALCCGVELKWRGVAEAWLVPGRVSIEHGTLLSRGARRFFDNIGAELGLRRMQIVVCVDREKAIQWAKFLKFKEEGLMKGYGPEGKDYYMYARMY